MTTLGVLVKDVALHRSTKGSSSVLVALVRSDIGHCGSKVITELFSFHSDIILVSDPSPEFRQKTNFPVTLLVEPLRCPLKTGRKDLPKI